MFEASAQHSFILPGTAGQTIAYNPRKIMSKNYKQARHLFWLNTQKKFWFLFAFIQPALMNEKGLNI